MNQSLEKKDQLVELLNGVKDTFPMLIGASPFAVIFGTLSVTSGLSTTATMGLSAFVFAGASQFIAIALVAEKASLPVIWLTTFVVNFRHILYSATLLPKLKHLSKIWKIVLAFGLTDETFATAIKRFETKDDHTHPQYYLLGSTLAMYLNWNFWTVIGIFAGNLIPNVEKLGLDFAMIATFTGIVVPLVKNRPMLFATLSAGLTAVLTYQFPFKTGIIATCLIGVLVGLISEKQNSPSIVEPKK